ncbi:MAG: hypothetical protein ACN4E6_07310 [Qipengyuania pacifica]
MGQSDGYALTRLQVELDEEEWGGLRSLLPLQPIPDPTQTFPCYST